MCNTVYISSKTEDGNSVNSNFYFQAWEMVKLKAQRMLLREAASARAEEAREQRRKQRHLSLMRDQAKAKRLKIRRFQLRWRRVWRRKALPIQAQSGGEPDYLERESFLPPTPVIEIELPSRETLEYELYVRAQESGSHDTTFTQVVTATVWGFGLAFQGANKTKIALNSAVWILFRLVLGSQMTLSISENLEPIVSSWTDLVIRPCAATVNALTFLSRRFRPYSAKLAGGDVFLEYLVGVETIGFCAIQTLAIACLGNVFGVMAFPVVSILLAPSAEECFKRVSPSHCRTLVTLEGMFKTIGNPENLVSAMLCNDSHYAWASSRLSTGIHLHTINNILCFSGAFLTHYLALGNIAYFVPCVVLGVQATLGIGRVIKHVVMVASFLPGVDFMTRIQAGILYDAFVAEGGLETTANLAAFGLSATSGGVNMGNVVQLITAVTTQGRGPSVRGAVELVCHKFIKRSGDCGIAQPQGWEDLSAKGINSLGEFVSKVSQLTNNDLLRAVTCLYSSFLLIPIIVGSEADDVEGYLKRVDMVDDHMFAVYKKSKSQFATSVLESVHAGLVWCHASLWGSSQLKSSDELSKLLTEVAELKAKRDRIRTVVGDDQGGWIPFSEYQRRVSSALARTSFLMSKRGLPPTMLSTFQ